MAVYNREQTASVIIGPAPASHVTTGYASVIYGTWLNYTNMKWATAPDGNAYMMNGGYPTTGDFNRIAHYSRIYRYPMNASGTINPGYKAAWGPLQVTYSDDRGGLNKTVTYDPISGSGITKGTWVDYKLESTKALGWKFLGWEASSGTIYQPGDVLPISEFPFADAKQGDTPGDLTTTYIGSGTATVTAKWEKAEYNMTVAEDNVVKVINGNMLPSISGEFKRTGYHFKGLCLNGNTNIRVYDENLDLVYVGSLGEGICDFTTDVVLEPIWVPITFTIKFDVNTGDNQDEMPEITATYDAIKDISSAVAKKVGYTFTGWKYNNTVYNKTIPASVNFTSEQDSVITMIAVWEVNIYTVSYRVTDNDTTTDTQKISHNSDVGQDIEESIAFDSIFTPSIAPYKYGYKFLYWELGTMQEIDGKIVFVVEKQFNSPFVWKYPYDVIIIPVFQLPKNLQIIQVDTTGEKHVYNGIFWVASRRYTVTENDVEVEKTLWKRADTLVKNNNKWKLNNLV